MTKRPRILVAAAVAALAATAAQAQQAGVTRTELQRHDLSVPGREVVQVRVELARAATVARHSHPGEEVVYALGGAMEYQFDDRPPVTLQPGSVLFIPMGVIHAVRNLGDGGASEVSTYIVEKGKPLVIPAK